MGFLLSLAVIGVMLLIFVAVRSFIDVVRKNARTHAISVAGDALERQARKPGWRRVADDEEVPAGRTSADDRTRHAAVAGTCAGRTVRIAVFSSSMPDSTWQGVTTSRALLPGLVVAVDAPELPGSLQLNPIRGTRRYGVLGSLEPLVSGDTAEKVSARLDSTRRPSVDVGDGVACFTFTHLDLADRIDDLVAQTCDVVELLVTAGKPTSRGED